MMQVNLTWNFQKRFLAKLITSFRREISIDLSLGSNSISQKTLYHTELALLQIMSRTVEKTSIPLNVTISLYQQHFLEEEGDKIAIYTILN